MIIMYTFNHTEDPPSNADYHSSTRLPMHKGLFLIRREQKKKAANKKERRGKINIDDLSKNSNFKDFYFFAFPSAYLHNGARKVCVQMEMVFCWKLDCETVKVFDLFLGKEKKKAGKSRSRCPGGDG